ncbi:MAG TPA: PEP-CTERM sorting domain-containing protein [Pirellulaceae bacterium]|nr:PEP-CTERM sorting domain-containing protein [Pirellulaceae bacterium]
MKHIVRAAVLAVMLGALAPAIRADELWNNGPMITHAGGMSNGADRSAIGTGGTLFGFGVQQTAGNRMADDFSVGGLGWFVDSIRLFTYQTGSSTTSTLTGVTLRIWDGLPQASNLVWGDETTNVLAATGFTNIYRTTGTVNNDFNRPIMFVDINLGGLNLGPGTYYLDWSLSGSLASGPWAPPVADPSNVLIAGNALQRVGAAGVYNPALDGTTQMALPFIINGTAIVIPEPATGALLIGLLGMFAVRRRK